ncbi:MAG: hypothetical protein AVDCRST_MAG93-6821 [uncultured Chloroflexia bacterium]|uniref:Uncharacterized protein n=1 Tax=uncultured Chloroflexia bacterium TaxID=1672391 RepID=A0A6J4M2L4_9CHLR|nr:MAG: hypothetical protein AVDCRST_MAG93-6821 [uncultured Chloroflexia bacterium]
MRKAKSTTATLLVGLALITSVSCLHSPLSEARMGRPSRRSQPIPDVLAENGSFE